MFLVCAPVQQYFGFINTAECDGVTKRGVTVSIGMFDGDTVIQQQSDNGRLAKYDGIEQHGFVRVIDLMQVCPAGQQPLDCLRTAPTRGFPQRRVATMLFLVYRGVIRKQQLHSCMLVFARCLDQWNGAIPVFFPLVRTCFEQHPCSVEMIAA